MHALTSINRKFLVESNYYALLKEKCVIQPPAANPDVKYELSAEVVENINDFLDLKLEWTPSEYSVIKELATTKAFDSCVGIAKSVLIDDDYQYTFPDDKEQVPVTKNIDLKFCFPTTFDPIVDRIDRQAQLELERHSLSASSFLETQLLKFTAHVHTQGKTLYNHRLEDTPFKYNAWKNLFYQVYVNRRGYQKISCHQFKTVVSLKTNIDNDQRSFGSDATDYTMYMARVYDIIFALYPSSIRDENPSLPLTISTKTPIDARKRSVEKTSPNKMQKITINQGSSELSCRIKCNHKLYISSNSETSDCQFLALCTILNSRPNTKKVTVQNLRALCAERAEDSNRFSDIALEEVFYKHMDEQDGEPWLEPFQEMVFDAALYRKVMAKAIRRNQYWGDDWTVNVIAEFYGLCLFVINENCKIIHETPFCKSDAIDRNSIKVAVLHLKGRLYSSVFSFQDSKDFEFLFDFSDDCISKMMQNLRM